MEATQNSMMGLTQEQRGMIPNSTKEEDTFTELRQILLNFGHRYDAGGRVFVLQDTQQESAIIVRLLDVRAIDDKSPLLVLLYKPVKPTPAKRLYDVISPFIAPSTAIISVSTTELERKMFLKLVSQNAKHVSSSYKPQRSPTESDFTLSVMLPLGPLNMHDLGKLNSNFGCELCGKREASKCTGCFSVVYCGKECQTADWKDHKKTCKTLKGGTWLTIHFERPPGFSTIMNRYDSPREQSLRTTVQSDADGPPPNIHSNKIFLVKMQSSLTLTSDADAQMLIYDRQRSFQAYWKKYGGSSGHDDFEVYRKAEREIAGGWQGIKMYRWARRVGDYELSVCFDRAPGTDPVW